MSIRSREQALFEDWRRRRPGVVYDGVVDEACYLDSHPRILFLLKEVSNPKRLESKPEGWDLRAFLHGGGIRVLWDNVARWATALRSDPSPPWSAVAYFDDERRAMSLRSLVAMNLKKVPGGGNANHDEIRQVAAEDQALLRSQYGLYNPDIVMCCGEGVRQLFSDLILQDGHSRWRAAPHDYLFTTLGGGRLAIEFCHPQVRSSHERVYGEFVEMLYHIRGAA